MKRDETSLEKARRLVMEAEQRVARQRSTIADMKSKGFDTERDEAALAIFVAMLRFMHEDLADEIKRAGPLNAP